MEFTKDDLTVENKRAKVVLLEKYETANNSGVWYSIEFDNGDFGKTKIEANSKVYLIENSNWVEYTKKVNFENGITFIEIIKGETN